MSLYVELKMNDIFFLHIFLLLKYFFFLQYQDWLFIDINAARITKNSHSLNLTQSSAYIKWILVRFYETYCICLQ